MSTTQGEEKPVRLRAKLLGGGAVIVLVAAVTTTVAMSAHAAQVKADAEHAMTVAAPAYQGTIDHAGGLDTLTARSVQAKKDFDTEQARLAAQKTAQEAAAAQAAKQAAAQADADEAARQAAANDQRPNAADEPPQPPVTSAHGRKVPWIPSDDPQNADGGTWDMSVCNGGSASTGADGTPYCD